MIEAPETRAAAEAQGHGVLQPPQRRWEVPRTGGQHSPPARADSAHMQGRGPRSSSRAPFTRESHQAGLTATASTGHSSQPFKHSGNLGGSQGKCWDQLTWPRGPLAFQPGLALGQDRGGLWVQVSAGWWMNLASLLTAPKAEGGSHTGNLPALLGSPAVSPTPFQALPPQP